MSKELNIKSELTRIRRQDTSNTCEALSQWDHSQWILDDYALVHRSRGFFQVIGMKSQSTNEESLILYQPQSALCGLIFTRINDQIHALIHARFEPGNPDFYQFGPTIQSTAANYLRVHGGKATPYYEFFSGYSPNIRPLYTTTQFDLEHRYFQKTKVLSYLWADIAFEPEQNFIWAPLDELINLAGEDEFFNPDLRSLLILFDWSRIPGATRSVPNFSLDFGNFRSEPARNSDWKIVPLQSLKRWRVTEEGIIDSDSEGLNVRLYDIYCQSRENPRWVQPLMEAGNEGLVQLGIRHHAGGTEFLIYHQHMMGVGPQGVVLPSYWRYPGQTHGYGNPLTGSVIRDFVQSDEGGRFIRHANRYQVIEVDGLIELQPGQAWVTESQLKNLLHTSNLIGFSLRIALSSLLNRFVSN